MKIFSRGKRSCVIVVCFGAACVFWTLEAQQHRHSFQTTVVSNRTERSPREGGRDELWKRTAPSFPFAIRHNQTELGRAESVTNDGDPKGGVFLNSGGNRESALSISPTTREPDRADSRRGEPATNNYKAKDVDPARVPGVDDDGPVVAPRFDAAVTGGGGGGEVGEAHGNCPPHHHVVFLKVHKAASSTVTNILQRFGFTRNLSFVLPNRPPHAVGYNYLSRYGAPLQPLRDIIPPPPPLPPPLGGQRGFDILCNHAVYERGKFRSFMPNDSVYVAILREPFQQFVSAFTYYRPRSNSDRISAYLHDGRTTGRTGLANMQARDFGMTAQHMLNASLRRQYLQQLGRDLRLVMLVEFFDESIVLMRRLLCWSVKDVLYIPKNKNGFKPRLVFSSEDRAKHQQIAEADYDLYTFFRDKFLRTLAAQTEGFRREVRLFKQVQHDVAVFCDSLAKARCGGNTTNVLSVAESQWNQRFVVTCEDCKLLKLPELPFLDTLLSARFSVGDLSLVAAAV